MNQMLKKGYDTNWGENLQQKRIFFPDDFLYPIFFCCGSTAVVVCEVIRSSNCGNDASKEVEADVVMWLDPKEPVKLGVT